MARLRAVADGEMVGKSRVLSVTKAASEGTPRELLMAMRDRVIPGTNGFEQANVNLRLDESPFVGFTARLRHLLLPDVASVLLDRKRERVVVALVVVLDAPERLQQGGKAHFALRVLGSGPERRQHGGNAAEAALTDRLDQLGLRQRNGGDVVVDGRVFDGIAVGREVENHLDLRGTRPAAEPGPRRVGGP